MEIRKPGLTELYGINFLEREWEYQSKIYLSRNVHVRLGLSEEEYLASLPKFEPQPEAFAGRFDVPLLVDPRVDPLDEERTGMLDYTSGRKNQIVDWEGDPKGYRTPSVPYTTWFQSGDKYLDQSPSKVRENLAEDERGATLYDFGAFYFCSSLLHHSSFVGTYLPGTSLLGGKFVAYVITSQVLDPGGTDDILYPGLHHKSATRETPGFNNATCGRNAA